MGRNVGVWMACVGFACVLASGCGVVFTASNSGGSGGDGGSGGAVSSGGSGGTAGTGGSVGTGGTGGVAGTGGNGGFGGDGGSGGVAGTGGNGGTGGMGGSGGGTGLTGGTVRFTETFEDADFASRGWYDGSNGALSTTEHIAGSSASFACLFEVGASSCRDGKPARHLIPPSETAYLSFWIKHSDNWVGSGLAYHPHLFHFTTTEDSDWIGPSATHLTTYIESPQGRPMLALQDSLNVDTACILRNDDAFIGCGGDFATYPFDENRSVCACNGLVGYLEGRDCFDAGSTWYSARSWRSATPYFTDDPGPTYKGDWHFIEAYFEMNSIAAGVGVADGRIRYWYDGELLINSDNILMRTAAHPDQAFSQFLFLPHIGPGSPVEQTFWVDDLTVATAPP